MLVEQSLKYLDSLVGESADDLVLQSELAAAYEKVGIPQGESRKPSLGDFRGAIASLEKTQAICRRLLEINPNDAENRRLLAENLRLIGTRRMYQYDAEGGIRDGQEAVRIYEQLVTENPNSLTLQMGLLETRVEDAVSYADIARFAEAVPMLERTIGKVEDMQRNYPDNSDILRILAKNLAYLGHSLSWENRQTEAEAAMTRAVEITESLAARHPNDTNFRQDLWRIYQSAAGIYDEVDNQRMFELCEKAGKVMEETIMLDPANAQARHNLALTLSKLGTAASNLGKSDEGLQYLEQAAAIFAELQAKDALNHGLDQDASAVQARIGDAKYKRGDRAGALAAYEQSRALLEKQYERDSANTRTMRNLAVAYRNVGWVHHDHLKTANREARLNHLETANQNYRQSLEILTRLETQNSIAEFDKKIIGEVGTAIEELEKMR